MARLTVGTSAGEVLGLIASGEARTRGALARHTGLSRATMGERLETLFRAGLIDEGELAKPSGGRPSRVLALDTRRYVVLAADVGEDHVRLLLTDLTGRVVAERLGSMPVSAGAVAVLGWVTTTGRRLLDEADRSPHHLLGVGLSLPALVDHARGRVASPSVMTGWEGYDIEELVRQTFDVPTVVENDVNARGYAEHRQDWRSFDDLLYVKAGTGIGSAIISAGGLFRGARGAAGDIGHLRLSPDDGPLCRCGATGCVESLAAGWSIVRDLRAAGFDVSSTREAMDLVRGGTPEAVNLLRAAGRTLGRAIAYAVSLLNPSIVVVGGSLSSHHLLTGVRESVYSCSPPLATNDLRVVEGRGGERSGATGAALLAVARSLEPDAVNGRLRDAEPVRVAVGGPRA
ncbi:ROK family transcriptional regulator [Microlunatus antarcticus]|uniref:Putative NBD/HSP70 family sugar kinase n=1 Tax=Microlunatus antarcticus TaxID=53388 RepID=A0A7W5JZD7_9ACTN|nr:ROK family protein [Microlunatus antarcticus]MBB3328946.1 putative NBD/HSP70 family sugar kinase [Microlunatus antarcticus]